MDASGNDSDSGCFMNKTESGGWAAWGGKLKLHIFKTGQSGGFSVELLPWGV
jgi:hypothetical protein